MLGSRPTSVGKIRSRLPVSISASSFSRAGTRISPESCAAGTTPGGVAQTGLSRDGKSVFVHLPKLPAVHQLEVRHDFKLASGAAARGVAYFTIHQPHALDPVAAGFPQIDFSKMAKAAVREKEEQPTAAHGKNVAETTRCVVCH